MDGFSKILYLLAGLFHTLLFHRTLGKVRIFPLVQIYLAVATWVSYQGDHYKHVFSVFFVQFCFEFQFHYKQEGSYSIGTVGWVDEDCDFVDFTYVSLRLRNNNTC